MPAPGAQKKVVVVLLTVLTLIVGAVGFVLYQVTRPIDPGWVDKVNAPFLAEATRKIKLVTDAQKASKRGFVSLSEGEINAYIAEFAKGALKAGAKTNAPGAILQKSLLELSFDGITWDTALEKSFYGHPVDFVWQRTFSVELAKSSIAFPLTEMRLGKISVPKKYWSQVQTAFGRIDDLYSSQLELATHLPAMAITTNDATRHPQLTLYSYSLNGGK